MRRRVLGIVTAFAPAIVIAIAGWSHRWLNEDAFINLRVVDQVFAGHGPVFNATERVEATTSPLWLAVLVAGRALTGWFARAEWIAVIASLLAAVGAFVVAGLATRLRHRGEEGIAVPVGLLLVAAVTVVWDFSTSGLEMGLVWLWLAASWFVLVSAVRGDEIMGWRRVAFGAVLGLAPVVRPELTLMMVCFVAAWVVLARPRRVLLDLVAILAVPVLYEVFRMGFYASLVPNTALAKDAGGVHWGQGWRYLRDFADAYYLWVTIGLIAAAIVVSLVRARDRRIAVAVGAVVAGAVLDALYIVAIGGDYMHGRLLLPAFFALGLPASLAVRPREPAAVAIAVGAGVWSVVTLVAFRPPPPPSGFFVAPVADWRALSGGHIFVDFDPGPGFDGYEAADAYDRGLRGYFGALQEDPRPAKDRDAFVYTFGSIGAPAYYAGRQIWVIDIGGLAEPLAARTSTVPGRPAGHRKQVDAEWYDARFAAPDPDDTERVVAARRALRCAPVSDLLDAVNERLTPGRFLSNVWNSLRFTRVAIPADPVDAERRWCEE